MLQITKFQAPEGETYESVRPQGFKLRGRRVQEIQVTDFQGEIGEGVSLCMLVYKDDMFLSVSPPDAL